MGTRHNARELAVQFLFQRDFTREDLDQELKLFWAGQKVPSRERAFAEALIRGVEANRAEIDEKLKSYAEHWSVKRMGGVDRNVMRVALHEMLHRPDIPPVVSINEAVEIAKAYSSFESGKFVNGILDRAARDVQRPAREAMDGGKAPE